jgi:hypothetical protein
MMSRRLGSFVASYPPVWPALIERWQGTFLTPSERIDSMDILIDGVRLSGVKSVRKTASAIHIHCKSLSVWGDRQFHVAAFGHVINVMLLMDTVTDEDLESLKQFIKEEN